MNSYVSGIQNEIEFTEYLNNKEYYELGSNASKFIKQIHPEIKSHTKISAEKIGGMGLKPDITINIEQEQTFVSLKKGTGNSVHQETTSKFLLFCKNELNMSDEVRDSFLLYLYGDGTFDGKGDVEDRLDGEELRTTYSSEIKLIQTFLNSNKRILLERFLVYGRRGKELNIKADYLYHGYITEGVWGPLDYIVDYLIEASETDKSQGPSIGPLTLQTWNRNVKGNPQTENRRHSIQIKWGGNITEQIKIANERYLYDLTQTPEKTLNRIFGDNSHGFRNSAEIAKGLDDCKIKNIRGALLGLINTIFPSCGLSSTINCVPINRSKPDIKITIEGISKNVSVFIGSGNAVHQENFDEFVEYCKTELNMTTNEEHALRLVYYGDGTITGNGKLENRLQSSAIIKRTYPTEINIAQTFFNKNKRALAKRFLVTGKYSGQPVADYIFHGDVNKGICLPYNVILDYIEETNCERNGLLSIGPLSFQMWNRNLSGEQTTEYKRKSIQIKWGSMVKWLETIQSYYRKRKLEKQIDGTTAEYELVALLNQNRTFNNPLWEFIMSELSLTNIENVFAVRATHLVESDFLGIKLYPKSDLYLCEADISEDILETNSYQIDETILEEENIKIKPIEGSGISCKIPSSTSFTYAKISPNNFEKIFGNRFLGAGASLFVKEEDTKLNGSVLNGWGISESDFTKALKDLDQFKEISNIKELGYDQFKQIKTYCINEIKNIIRCNNKIAGMIFLGNNLYKEPYNAKFLFSKGDIKLNAVPESFSITTGSGRHKGKFTIVVKP